MPSFVNKGGHVKQGGVRGGGGGGADPYEVDEGLGADDLHAVARFVDGHNLDDKGLAHALHAHDVVLGLHQAHPASHYHHLLQQRLPCNQQHSLITIY